MSPALKRVLLIVLLLSVAILIAVGLYYLFFRATPRGGPFVTERPTTTVGQLPAAGERAPLGPEGAGPAGQGALPIAVPRALPSRPSYYSPEPITKITSDFATFPSLGQNGAVRYHNVNDGKFYVVAPDGSSKALADQVFYNVEKVTWANTANKAVLEYPDSSKIIYNFDSKKQVTLPKHWEDFSFSPDSSEVAAKSVGLSPDNRWLVVTKDDGTGTRLIEPLGNNADRVTVDWSPSRQTVALSRTGQPQGADRQEVLLVGLNGENFKSTVVEGLDFESHWSPTGQKLLYSVDSARSDFKPELWVVNAYGDEIGSDRRALKINTWANKCTFGDDTTLFCAVPRELPVGAGMSPEIANGTPDDLYKIDLHSGLKTPISVGEQSHTMESLSFDKNKNKLFFTDHNQSGIFQVNL